MPSVSVIIPCYNAKSYIDCCFNALASQTFLDFEAIVIDDCSTDGTYDELCKKSETLPFKTKVLRTEQNGGPSKARQLGIEHSSSPWIAFCDSDDSYDPRFLQTMLAAAEKAQADITFCNYQRVYDSGKTKTCNVIGSIPRDKGVKGTMLTGVDSLCVMLIRRELVASVSMPDLRNGEDMAVVPVLISKAERFAFVDEDYYHYHYRTNSLSSAKKADIVPSLLGSFAYIEQHLAKNFTDECEFIGIRNVLYGTILNAFQCRLDKASIIRILTDFEQRFPNWYSNCYLPLLPSHKRLFVRMIKGRHLRMVGFMSYMHTLCLKWEVA